MTSNVAEAAQLALSNGNDLALSAPAADRALERASEEVSSYRTTIFDDPEHTRQALDGVGYMTTPAVATSIYFAARMQKPLLLEGPAGAGKTEMAVSIAKAEKLKFIRFQCYEGISDKQAIGDYNRALQEMFVLLQSKHQTYTWDEIRSQIVGRSYFLPGPLLEALESPDRVVLLFDELDKVDQAFEATLLEILSVWEMSVPGMGTIKSTNPPFTVITSNAERFLGYALRRRCIYLEIEHPTPQLEASIVARKTPHLSREVHFFIAGFAQALRAYTMDKPPSISEMNDLAMALDLLGRTTILPQDKDILLPLLAKTDGDRKRLLMKENFENLVATAATNRDQLMGRSTKPKEIVAMRPRRLATHPTEGEVLPPSKDQKPGRLDAWAMRTLMRGLLLLLLTFFSVRGLAQHTGTPERVEEATQEVAPGPAQEPAQAPELVWAPGPISTLNLQRPPEIVYRPPEIVYYADAYADYYHVPRELVYAIITHESGWKPRVVSNKGAMGLMQLMPATAANYYVTNPFDIAQNIGGGVHYLADLIARLGDWRLAVASYYCGPTYPQQRGLLYSNPEVVAYVAAIQRLYMRELFVKAKQASPEVQHGVETTQSQIQVDTPEVQP